jgi:membrane protease YdiL (CAAX protease family)
MKKVIQFIVIVCLFSWIYAGVGYLFGIRTNTLSYTVFAAAYMFLPAIMAIILQKQVNKEPVVKPLFVSFKLNRWFVVAIVTPLFLVCLSIFINLIFPEISFSNSYEGLRNTLSDKIPENKIDIAINALSKIPTIVLFLIIIAQSVIAGLTVNALFAFGEELGWRGYMLHHLRKWRFIPASLLIGFVWGIWHFPLILMGHNYPTHNISGVFMMIIFCTLLTPIMIYIVIKSKSVITAAIFHGTINAAVNLPLLYLVGGNDLNMGFTGCAGFISIALVVIILYLFDRFMTKENIFSSDLDKLLPNE